MQPSDSQLELTHFTDQGSPTSRNRKSYHKGSQTNENKFFLHLGLLLKKNYLVQRRSPRALLFQTLIPFLICILINYWQKLADSVFTGVEIDSKITPISKIPHCFYSLDNPNDCTTIAYGILGPSEPWIHSVMKYVASTNDLEMGKDVKFINLNSPGDFSTYLTNNLNKTELGVIFCTSEWPLFNVTKLPCKFEAQTEKKLVMYNILYNVSEYIRPPAGDDFKIAHPKHPFASSLKMSLDNAIISYFTIDKESKGNLDIDLASQKGLPKMTADQQDFPKTHFRFVLGSDVVNLFGGLQFSIPFMLNFLVTSFEIVREKNKRLREGLTVMGMSATSYWISWAITCIVTNLLITSSTVLAGSLFGYAYFTDTPFLILFSLFFLLGLALQGLAILISTISATATIAYVFSYGVLLVCVVLTLFINHMGVCYVLFMKKPPLWFVPIRWLFQVVPAFDYALLFVTIGQKSGQHYDIISNSWQKGTGFTYDDLFAQHEGSIPNLVDYHMPSAWNIFMILLKDLALFLVLAWYCDNVLSHNRGTASSPLFFLKKKYWKNLANETREKTRQVHTPKAHNTEHANYDYKNLSVENSVENERERVLQNHQMDADCKGLRVVGIDKIYRSSMFRRTNKDIHAVKSVYLEVEDGELLSILGHNGAGKTTLIGVLTGLLKPTSGTAEMYNYDISSDMDSIRQIMGVCPQFDILWDELTAFEHLHMFAKLKGIPENLIPGEIDKRLRDVNLLSVKHAMAGTFSGGMKRRLSMAIAFIGDPRIVFLDEPTTGMDPKNRRYIWELIQKMKQGRVVILTTHAMEEADILSDRIAVVSQGSLRCVGTGLYLKNKYGDGYRLSVVVEKEEVDDMTVELTKVIPSGKVLDSSGGSILLGVPIIKVDELKEFFKIMENKIVTPEAVQFKSKVKDWGLSHTTLEEVFMKITSGKH